MILLSMFFFFFFELWSLCLTVAPSFQWKSFSRCSEVNSSHWQSLGASHLFWASCAKSCNCYKGAGGKQPGRWSNSHRWALPGGVRYDVLCSYIQYSHPHYLRSLHFKTVPSFKSAWPFSDLLLYIQNKCLFHCKMFKITFSLRYFSPANEWQYMLRMKWMTMQSWYNTIHRISMQPSSVHNTIWFHGIWKMCLKSTCCSCSRNCKNFFYCET